MFDLFADMPASLPDRESLGEGAMLLRRAASAQAGSLLEDCALIAAAAPFRRMTTPGGFTMSVAMTGCGIGWITERRGYRYDAIDPDSGGRWPPMPSRFSTLAAGLAAQAGFDGFEPDSCLINMYEPAARLSLHQDRNERDFAQPIVSISLGLPATFLFGGVRRTDRPRRLRLDHGDVVVWGGPSRLAFHGVAPLAEGHHPLTGRRRINLTFRRAL